MNEDITVVYENATYQIIIAADVKVHTDFESRAGYIMVNKQYNIIEYEDYLLPAIIEMADHMDASYRNHKATMSTIPDNVAKMN